MTLPKRLVISYIWPPYTSCLHIKWLLALGIHSMTWKVPPPPILDGNLVEHLFFYKILMKNLFYQHWSAPPTLLHPHHRHWRMALLQTDTEPFHITQQYWDDTVYKVPNSEGTIFPVIQKENLTYSIFPLILTDKYTDTQTRTHTHTHKLQQWQIKHLLLPALVTAIGRWFRGGVPGWVLIAAA